MALIQNLNANFKQLQEVNKVNNGYLTGQVSTEKKMFEQVKAMKRSTFDRSKFTVVGNPSITNDGIASGFSGSNYLNVNNITFGSNFCIYCDFILKNIQPNQENFFWKKDWNFGLLLSTDNTNFAFRLPKNSDGSEAISRVISLLELNAKLGDRVRTKCSYNDTQGLIFEASIDGVNWIKSTHNEKTNYAFPNIENFTIGQYSNTTYSRQDIDLKQFSITVDGVEVFNGNKTGIDQIKKDNYTKGSAVIVSPEGIASGYTYANEIVSPNITLTQDDDVIIKGSFTVPSGITGNTFIYQLSGGYLHFCILLNQGYGGSFYYAGKGVGLGYTFEVGKKYYYEMNYNAQSKTSYVNIYDNNKILVKTSPNTAVVDNFNYTEKLYIGTGAVQNINLNDIAIIKNGVLIYQPTLRIPYTQSKTGSKIVDAEYRGRVQDMYEQFGSANYYTLGDNDFTIPQGEVYGMIENKQDLIEDLSTIREGAFLGSTALQYVPSKYATLDYVDGRIQGYHDISKQDTIYDLDTIRAGASLGATALQSVPSEYVNETKLNNTLESTLKDYSHLIYNSQAFTVVGTPTITEDGIASRFSGSNYLKTNSYNNSIVTFKIKLPNGSFSGNIGVLNFSNPNMRLLLTSTYSLVLWHDSLTNVGSISNLSAGANLLVSLDFVAHKMYVTNLDTNITTSSNINSSVNVTNGTMFIGIETATNIGFTGSIDLKHFSITVDGTEVFNGALKNTKNLGAFPSDKYIDLALGASGATYTAPANGWFCLNKRSGGSNRYISLQGKVESSVYSSNTGQDLATNIPCKKGDNISITYTASSDTNLFRFIYAEGAN